MVKGGQKNGVVGGGNNHYSTGSQSLVVGSQEIVSTTKFKVGEENSISSSDNFKGGAQAGVASFSALVPMTSETDGVVDAPSSLVNSELT